MLQFVPTASCHGSEHTNKNLASSSLHPPFRCLQTFIRSPMCLLFSGLDILALSGFLHRRSVLVTLSSWWASSELFPVYPCLSWRGGGRAQNWTQYSKCSLTDAEKAIGKTCSFFFIFFIQKEE